MRTRLAGICGSDLSLVGGHASTYFEDWVSFPFVPGHEVVGELVDGDDAGTRVVLEPVLGHAARGVPLPFEGARPADGDDYAHLAVTSDDGVEPAIQTGFCCSTGGGWAPWFWAHESQLHRLDQSVDTFPDERAVLIEPFAGGIHAALLAAPTVANRPDPVVAVLGAGTMGLAAIAGLRRYVPGVRIVVGARYPHQRELASAFGADVVVGATELDRAVRREVGCHMLGNGESGALSGGADVTIDAVGSSGSIADCLRITRPRGRVVLLGMPARVDSTSPDSGIARSNSRAPTPTAPRPSPTARSPTRSAWPPRPSPPSKPSGWCRPPIPSITTSTPSNMPPTRDAAARSRSHSICDDCHLDHLLHCVFDTRRNA